MSSPRQDAAPGRTSATTPDAGLVIDAVIDGQPARLVLDGHRDDLERFGEPEIRHVGGGLTALVFRRRTPLTADERQQLEDEADAAWVAQARGEHPSGRFTETGLYLNPQQAAAFDAWAATQDGAKTA